MSIPFANLPTGVFDALALRGLNATNCTNVSDPDPEDDGAWTATFTLYTCFALVAGRTIRLTESGSGAPSLDYIDEAYDIRNELSVTATTIDAQVNAFWDLIRVNSDIIADAPISRAELLRRLPELMSKIFDVAIPAP